jgi:hypothetical protein
MDLILRALSIVFIITGLPLFLSFSAMFVGILTPIGAPPGPHLTEDVTKVLLLYVAFALAGLMTAAGCVLWAVTRIAYPRRRGRSWLPPEPLPGGSP